MKKFSILMALMMLLGFSVSCDRRGDNDFQREESPIEDAGDRIEDGADELGDEAEDAVD
ncbi:MAG: hypothetical protein H0V66_12945 [Bdellovibrionales bacterium]|nr:hypothetical protein [Bdellovibrionales bacterium]